MTISIEEVTQLVDEIQQVLTDTNDPYEEELIDLAARHDECVEQVTKRLGEVEKLLDKGLRSEAVELSEQAPNLNDLVTVLDFAEMEVWNDFLQQYDIQMVRELPVDIATELNDAYAISGSLQRLLKLFRTQSLAKAPLNERIETLRKLAVEDQANTQWSVDIKTFETHRIGLLKNELQKAIKDQDLERVASLDHELSAGRWAVKVPGKLINTAREGHRQLRQVSARQELETLCPQLSDAYSAFDRPNAMTLQNRFFALAEILDLQESDPLYDIAGPALDWLNEEEKKAAADADFAEGKAQLEAALERNTSIEELERLYHQCVRHGHTLPEALENRVADRSTAFKTAETRKRHVRLASITGICIASIVAVVLTVQTVAFNNALAEHVAQATALLSDSVTSGDFQPVDDYFAGIEADDARYLEQPDLLGLKGKVELARTKENGRQSQLDQLITNCRKKTTEDASWQDFSQADKLLKEAKAIALNSSELTRIQSVRSQIDAARSQLQTHVDDAFNKDLAEIIKQIDELPRDSVDGHGLVLSQLYELEEREHVSPQLTTALPALKGKVTRDQGRVQVKIDIDRDLRKVTSTAGQPDRYRQSLLKYIQAHPNTPRSGDFQSVLEADEPLWEGVRQWSRLRQQLVKLSLQKVSAQEAVELVQKLKTLKSNSAPYPGETVEPELVTALTAVAARQTSADGTSRERIDRMFAPRTISQAYTVEHRADGKYYTSAPPKVTKSAVDFNYYVTSTGSQQRTKKIPRFQLKGPGERREQDWLSPQTVMKQLVHPQLQQQLETDFENAIVYGVDHLVTNDQIDPILTFLLLKTLLQTGIDGSFFIRERVDSHLETISQAGVSVLTNWAAPKDSQADSERDKARRYLKAHGEGIVLDLQQAVKDRDEFIAPPVGPAMEWVGCLHRDATTEWVVTLRDVLAVSASTKLVALGHVNGSPEFYHVATVTKDAPGIIPASSLSSCREGNPVYREIHD